MVVHVLLNNQNRVILVRVQVLPHHHHLRIVFYLVGLTSHRQDNLYVVKRVEVVLKHKSGWLRYRLHTAVHAPPQPNKWTVIHTHVPSIVKVLGNLVVYIERRLVVAEVPAIVITEMIHIGSLDQQLARVQRAPIQMVQEEQT